MMRTLLFIPILALAIPAQAEESLDGNQRRALAELASSNGPVRFGVVRGGIYRGGQPTVHHLRLLHDLGVETVIDLRRGGARKEEEAARRLGMRFLRFPFFGPFGADSDFLARVVDAIRHGGRVYVHCHIGRDRTSLVIALYRVLVEGWAPATAWQHDAVAYGYRPGLWYGRIQSSFDAAVNALAGKE